MNNNLYLDYVFIYERIKECQDKIIELTTEIKQLESFTRKSGIEKWLDFPFKSSPQKTTEFIQFAKEYKTAIKKRLPKHAELVVFNIEHFEISGFISQGCSFVYFYIPDVRGFVNEWYRNILIRKAKSKRDFTGGPNKYTALPEFRDKVQYLLSL